MAEDMKTICHSTTTFSSLLGSLTSVIRDYYKNNAFPKGYIKSYYISTRDFSEEIEEEDTIRKERPVMFIEPTFSFDGEDTIMGRLPDWQYSNDFIFKPMRYHYMKTLYDPNNEVYIYFSHERYKVSYNIQILFSSRMKAINAAHYFKNTIRHKRPFYLENIWLETTIPKTMIYGIADYFNMDLDNDEDLANLNNYLNNYSNFMIIRKKSLSSGIDNYYFKFKTRILVTFPNFPEVSDGSSVGQTVSDFIMSTTMEVEFNAPNNFFLELGDKVNIDKLSQNAKLEFLENENNVMVDFVLTTPMGETPDLIKEDVNKLIVWQGYIAESSIIDVVNIEEVLNKDINIIIEENNKIDPNLNNDIFEVLLYKDDEILNPVSYKMDWETKDLINKKPEKDATYYFGFYINTVKAKEILHNYYNNREMLDIIERTVKD